MLDPALAWRQSYRRWLATSAIASTRVWLAIGNHCESKQVYHKFFFEVLSRTSVPPNETMYCKNPFRIRNNYDDHMMTYYLGILVTILESYNMPWFCSPMWSQWGINFAWAGPAIASSNDGFNFLPWDSHGNVGFLFIWNFHIWHFKPMWDWVVTWMIWGEKTCWPPLPAWSICFVVGWQMRTIWSTNRELHDEVCK